MSEQHATPGKAKQHKDTQQASIYTMLQALVCTATMLSTVTGIPQKNICRRKRELEKADRLWVVRIAPCAETGCMAQWLTTNPDRKPATANQLTLFSHD